ncbi:MAG: aminotransferase class V-fold PLP-dependent enzyme [Acidimicrobiales bacterium]
MDGWTRRDFLTRAGGVAGALAVTAGCSSEGDGTDGTDGDRGEGTSADDTNAMSAPFDPGDWGSVRDQFPLTPDLRHFAAFVLAAHPRPVADAIQRYRDALSVDTHGALEEFGGQEEAVRGAAADYLGVDAGEVALTDSTTMGLGLVYGGLRLGAGDEVVTTEHDFFATHESLRLRAERDGTVVRRVSLYDDPSAASVDEIVSRFVAGITPATRVAAVTWVHSGTGVKLPIAAMGSALAGVNEGRDEPDRVLLCVDGVHGFGLEPVGAQDLQCDFLVSGTHKWLFGPRGTGLVWGRPAAWARFQPLFASFSVPASDDGGPAPGRWATPGGYHSFEHRWAVDEAFAFHEAIGRNAIHERTQAQASALKAGLAEIDGVRVVTPSAPELSAGIVCVDIDGQQPSSLIDPLLEGAIVASMTPYDDAYLRFGPSIVTSPEDVDAAVSALASLA